jgi:hypothetical protein
MADETPDFYEPTDEDWDLTIMCPCGNYTSKGWVMNDHPSEGGLCPYCQRLLYTAQGEPVAAIEDPQP